MKAPKPLLLAIATSTCLIVLLIVVGLWHLMGGAKPPQPQKLPQTKVEVELPVPPELQRSTDEHGVTKIYANDFAANPSVGPEWSHTHVTVTPAGERPYLGNFVQDPVFLTLDKLPQHKLVRITFDLFLLRCWDGSSKVWGEKIWDLDVVSGQNLIHTTFSNAGFFSDNNQQAFPDTFPCRPLPAWTGTAEKQTLGTIQSWGGKDRTFDASGVYHFSLAFPHTAADVEFQFKATMRKSTDKSWGITNVKVETIPELTHFSDADLARLWKTLGDNESVKAFPALWELATAGDQATDYVAAHLADSCNATPAQIDGWISQLGTSDKDEASTAITGLIVQGKNSLAAITNKSRDSEVSPEVRRRLNYILGYISAYGETATELRNHRARHLLQVINTPSAIKLADTIPSHPDDSRDKVP